MNKKIAQLIGWQPPISPDPAALWVAQSLLPVTESFIRSQTERLDPSTLRVESVAGNLVTFAVDGYAADRESTRVFTATVRGQYDVTTRATTRLD